MACPMCGCEEGCMDWSVHTETHGLDCGPYETWLEEFVVCQQCRRSIDVKEWDECIPEEKEQI